MHLNFGTNFVILDNNFPNFETTWGQNKLQYCFNFIVQGGTCLNTDELKQQNFSIFVEL